MTHKNVNQCTKKITGWYNLFYGDGSPAVNSIWCIDHRVQIQLIENWDRLKVIYY